MSAAFSGHFLFRRQIFVLKRALEWRAFIKVVWRYQAPFSSFLLLANLAYILRLFSVRDDFDLWAICILRLDRGDFEGKYG